MKRALDFLALFLGILVLWQGLHWLAGDVAVTSPAVTFKHLGGLMASSDFWLDVAETGRALLYGALISLIGGVALGVMLGLNRLAGTVSEPILITLYSLPKVTLYPIVLLCFGLGLSAKVAFGAMHGLIPVTIFTMNAIMQIKPVYWRTAQALRLTARQTALTVALPAVIPEVIAGARIGFSLTLLGVLIGEMFASRRGLGFLITQAMGLGDIATIMAIALFLTVFAVTSNVLLLQLDRMVRR
jgi:NitT/TauT family transport system permease protein